ncbi:MAG TPA: hypothetical protein VFQ85_11820 [Mycobacteriales bacterium]|jgi:hypothetical protein|nr:hypothetical protein [Mycobacteriales bacterium]
MSHVRLASAAAVLAAAASALPAHAAELSNPGPGLTCGMSSTLNRTEEGDRQAVVVQGGPFPVARGTLRCTVQLNHGTHADPDAANPATGSVAGLVPPTNFGYGPVYPGDTVYLCTEFVEAGSGTRHYWVSSGTGTGTWSASSSAPCTLATEAGGAFVVRQDVAV